MLNIRFYFIFHRSFIFYLVRYTSKRLFLTLSKFVVSRKKKSLTSIHHSAIVSLSTLLSALTAASSSLVCRNKGINQRTLSIKDCFLKRQNYFTFILHTQTGRHTHTHNLHIKKHHMTNSFENLKHHGTVLIQEN